MECPRYDFTTHTRCEATVHTEPKPVILVDGILIFAEDELRSLFDLKIFADVDADVRILLRVKRDMQEREREFDDIMRQYLETVKPMHELYVEPSKRYADFVITDVMSPAARETVESRIELFLHTAT